MSTVPEIGEAFFMRRWRRRTFRFGLERFPYGANYGYRRRSLPARVEVYLPGGGRYLLANRLDV